MAFMDGHGGVRTWCGYGVFAHNAVKISRLIAAKNQPASIKPTGLRSTRIAETGTGPPGKSPPSDLPLSA